MIKLNRATDRAALIGQMALELPATSLVRAEAEQAVIDDITQVRGRARPIHVYGTDYDSATEAAQVLATFRVKHRSKMPLWGRSMRREVYNEINNKRRLYARQANKGDNPLIYWL